MVLLTFIQMTETGRWNMMQQVCTEVTGDINATYLYKMLYSNWK